MLKTIKPIPVVFSVASLLYFIYVVNAGSSKMIGDSIGGDPGGMVLPLFLSVFLFIASLYLVITDKRSGEQEKMTKEERQLFALTFLFSIGYIFLTRILGFLLCTVMLLYYLCFANQRKGLKHEDWKVAIIGGMFSLLSTVAVYSIGRFVTRTLLLASRKGTIPSWLGSSGVTSVLSVLILLSVVLLTISISRKRWPLDGDHDTAHAGWIAAVISIATTELLYIIFKQLFLVELSKGLLITW